MAQTKPLGHLRLHRTPLLKWELRSKETKTTVNNEEKLNMKSPDDYKDKELCLGN